ncbi:MAG: hypothetical protein EZS28_006173 [Streblomastix strix]|uniref:Uncharacterized protein n=1 Tax=Streblomastix strix TaxID=222440 RepID=A0A5J4WVQ6_9EUKA|nr:MAG: hypothetical protein EZS28_006173 [Streblomastix strix]
MTSIIPTILLCALPASGKSETRAFLRSLPPEKTREEFHLGFPTVQLDDYPYVEIMRFFDATLQELGEPRVFFYGEYYPFKDPRAWQALVELINEDFADVTGKKIVETDTPTRWIISRINRACESKEMGMVLGGLKPDILNHLSSKYDKHCAEFLKDRNAQAAGYTDQKTVVIEFARGGGSGSDRYPDFFPLPEPFGYRGSLPHFSQQILTNSAVLYVKVTPEQSFAKNLSRAPPPGYQGSTDIFHCVSEVVMKFDYGCDDFEYQLKQSDKPSTFKIIPVNKYAPIYVPVGILDNTEDLTTFCRWEVETWPKESIDKIYAAIRTAFQSLLLQYKAIHNE